MTTITSIMITYKVVLDEKRVKADARCPLMFRITFNRKTTNYSSGVSILKEHWNVEGSIINKSCPNYKELNKSLTTKFLNLQRLILKLEDEGSFSFDTLKLALNGNKQEPFQRITFLKFSEKLIDEMIDIKRTGNAIVYRTGVNRFINFSNNREIVFEQIDYKLLEAFKHQLIKDGVKPNTIGNYFRSIRAIFNKAIKAKIVDRTRYPFQDIQIKTEKTAKRAISIDDLRKIYNSSYLINSPKWKARNYFILSFSLRGISFTDMAYLTQKNIRKGRIEYKRRKTRSAISIRINQQSQEIFEMVQSDSANYLLPILPSQISEDSLEAKKVLYQWIKTTNKWLRALAKDCQIDADLTTYVTRHSWATAAKKLGFSNELIAEGLGHQYGNKITNIYLDGFDQSLIDEVNDKVLKSIVL